MRGEDGSVAGAFIGRGRTLASIRLVRPAAGATAPVTHLAGVGTVLPQGRAIITAAATSRGPVTLRLEWNANGGAWTAIGSPASTTERSLSVSPSSTMTRRFRVVPIEASGAEGTPAFGAPFRVVAKNETASSSLVYSGTWTTATSTAYNGGKVRYARSSRAAVRFAFTGSEIAWISSRTPGRGSARVYLDGAYAGTVNLAGAGSYRRIVFRRVLTHGGSHTLTLRPTGSGRVDVDGFIVLR